MCGAARRAGRLLMAARYRYIAVEGPIGAGKTSLAPLSEP